jgi:hypothetical protein
VSAPESPWVLPATVKRRLVRRSVNWGVVLHGGLVFNDLHVNDEASVAQKARVRRGILR